MVEKLSAIIRCAFALQRPYPAVDVSYSQGFDHLFDKDTLYADDPDLLRPALQQARVPFGVKLDSSNIHFEEQASSEIFEGICMDNGAQKSVAGLRAFERYCAHVYIPVRFKDSLEHFHLGKQVHPNLGQAQIRMHVSDRGNFLYYSTNFH